MRRKGGHYGWAGALLLVGHQQKQTKQHEWDHGKSYVRPAPLYPRPLHADRRAGGNAFIDNNFILMQQIVREFFRRLIAMLGIALQGAVNDL
jgi:hypothetical protein